MSMKSFLAAGVLAGLVALGVAGAATASASDMNIDATGGAGTTVVPSPMKPAVQGTPDDDNDQDAWLHPSQDFVPQFKAK